MIEYFRNVNMLNFEMETSAIFVLTNIYNLRAGTICALIANRETDKFIPEARVEDFIKVVNEVIKIHSEWIEETNKTDSKIPFISGN